MGRVRVRVNPNVTHQMQSQQLSNGLDSLTCVTIKIEKNEHVVVAS